MDRKNILPGQEWARTIQKAIHNSDFFLACLSKKSVNKNGFARGEIHKALDIWRQEKVGRDIYLIPVRLEECRVPNELNDIQYVNLFADEGWERLTIALKTEIERRQTSQEIEHQKEQTHTGQQSQPRGQSDQPINENDEQPELTIISKLAMENTPKDFLGKLPSSQSSSSEFNDLTTIRETMQSYRDQLSNDSQHLLQQARWVSRLWVGSVIWAGLLPLVVLLAIVTGLGGMTESVALVVTSESILYMVYRIFQQQEDHYRSLAQAKQEHLTYSNYLLWVIQQTNSIPDPVERQTRQDRLLAVLLEKLGSGKGL